MGMTSREIVRRTLEFDYPERVARSFAPSDFAWGSPRIPNPEGKWHRVDDREWRRTDVWGNVWARVDDTSKGEIRQGALEDLDDVRTFSLPDLDNPEYYRRARETFRAQPDLWHIGYIHGLTFSVARKLRRMEQYLTDLLLERSKIRILHDRIDELLRMQMTCMRESGAQSIMFAEDWGTQTGTLISPELWREEFKPRFEELCSHAHSLGLKVFMHSCGKLTAIVPDLIEVGVDLLQFDQPRIHGIDRLRRIQERTPVTFWCPVDIQTTLQSRSEALIRQEARELLDALWQGRGGFVAGYYGGDASLGLDPKWEQIACEEFLSRGKRALFEPRSFAHR